MGLVVRSGTFRRPLVEAQRPKSRRREEAMTNVTSHSDAPAFRVHARTAAFLRALVVAALCAALTAGFLAQVTIGASQQGASNQSQIATCSDTAGENC
jgi:hypothetical protein